MTESLWLPSLTDQGREEHGDAQWGTLSLLSLSVGPGRKGAWDKWPCPLISRPIHLISSLPLLCHHCSVSAGQTPPVWALLTFCVSMALVFRVHSSIRPPESGAPPLTVSHPPMRLRPSAHKSPPQQVPSYTFLPHLSPLFSCSYLLTDWPVPSLVDSCPFGGPAIISCL